MAFTYADVYRKVRLRCPLAPIMLCSDWVQEAYQEICDERAWSWLRAESEFLINDQKTGTCNVTRNSATVSGGTLAYATTDADRQFRVGTNGPIYTIITATASAYTLDRPYGGTTSTGASASVLDAYLSMPSDFQRFISVIDTANNWQLHLWVTEDEINSWDAQRSSTGTPWAVASRRLGTAGTYNRRIQYELWPYQTAAANYPYYYVRRPEALSDSTQFLGPLADDSSILVTLAMARCAEWPGVEGKKNPYFNLALASSLRKQARDRMDRLQVLDEEIYMTWVQTINLQNMRWAPLDSKFIQEHGLPALSVM